MELPKLAVTNVRSLLPHIKAFMEDIIDNNIDVSIVCEVWEKAVYPELYKSLEYYLEMKGLEFVSCGARKNKTRGGGAGIVVNTAKFSVRKLDILIPGYLEAVWTIIRPKIVTSRTTYREHIVVAFYSPPSKGKNQALLDHLITTAHSLLTKYPKAGLIIGGDRNSLDITPLITALPRTLQIVTKPTHNGKILDIIVTNLHQFYANPYILPPVMPDNFRTHKQSDHAYAVATPLAVSTSKVTREYTIRTVRPTPETARRGFGLWLLSESWESVYAATTPTLKVHQMRVILNEKVNQYFPVKTFKTSSQDLPYITAELKKLDRHKRREYAKHGASNKFKNMKVVFDEKLKAEARRYIVKNVTEAKTTNPAKANMILKKLATAPGDVTESQTFTLLDHLEMNLSDNDQRTNILKYFSAVSQEFSPLQRVQLPDEIQCEMKKHVNRLHLPKIDRMTMWAALKGSKKTKSEVPEEMPASLRAEFLEWLAEPASAILNSIIETREWPKQWKVEFGTPIPKESLPIKSEEQLRVISITAKLSMVCEQFLIKWLWEHLRKHMDRDQFGGLPGNSIAHYLIEVTNFILYNQDLITPVPTIMLLVDYSKGFNRINHNLILKDLFNMGVPGWLLEITASYLEGRTLRIRYKGETSEEACLPGGLGQGTLMGLWLFLVKMNGIGKAHPGTPLGDVITDPLSKRTLITEGKAKWIDDLTIVKAVQTKEVLEKVNEEELVRPLPYHARTEHRLKKHMNPMQVDLNDIFDHARENDMKVNIKKTKTMVFNQCKNADFEPTLSTIEGTQIDYVTETKLLGTILSEDLKTKSNTEYIVAKAYRRMWLLRRLSSLGCPQLELVNVYIQQIRSILELAVPYWGPRITQLEETHIERVQRTALRIIWGQQYLSYSEACIKSNIKTLKERRAELITKFAIKTSKNPKFASWFKKFPPKSINTRIPDLKLKPVPARTVRFSNSAIPTFTTLINNHHLDHVRNKCEVCGCTFTTSSNLKKHMLYTHTNKHRSMPGFSNRIF